MLFRYCPVPSSALAAATLSVLLFGGAQVVGMQTAEAQGWLGDRARTEGPGFRLGDFELHPGIGAEIGYDSNLYYTQDNAPHVDTGVLRLTPHLNVSTLGEERREAGANADDGDSPPPTVTFRGGLSAAYYEFFGDSTRRNLGIDASFRLNVLPERPFSFSLYDTFNRSIRPFTENSTGSAARIQNNGGLDLNFQTDGGIFGVRVGYELGVTLFEGSEFQFGNSMSHTVTIAETFRFLPSTGLVHDTSFVYNDYFNYDPSTSPLNLSDSARLRTRIGLNGVITDNISLTGLVGYAAGFFNNSSPTYAQEYDSIVASVEARWQVNPDVRLALGYDRDFYATYLGNYYSRDRGYIAFQSLIGGAFMLAIDGDVGYLDYGIVIAPDGTDAGSIPSREDIRVSGRLFAEYRFTDWLGVNGTLGYQGAFTDFQYRIGGAAVFDPAQFNRFEAYLGVRVFY